MATDPSAATSTVLRQGHRSTLRPEIEHTSTGKSTVPDRQEAAVPLVGQPNLCVTSRIGRRIRSDLQLKPAECRQIVHVYGRLVRNEVHGSISRVVGRPQESNVGYIFWRERLAIRLPGDAQRYQARQRDEQSCWRAYHREESSNTVKSRGGLSSYVGINLSTVTYGIRCRDRPESDGIWTYP